MSHRSVTFRIVTRNGVKRQDRRPRGAVDATPLQCADLDALPQRGQLVLALWNELLADVALVTGLQDRANDRRIIELLAVVDLRATGHAARVVVTDVFVKLADSPHAVALHDLHVIDVVEQLEPVRADRLAKLDAPLRVVAHVVLVVHPAVQQFHADRYPALLGQRQDPLQADRAVFQPLFIIQPVAVAREANQILQAGIRGLIDALLVDLDQSVVVFHAIKGLWNAPDLHALRRLARRIAHHRAIQIVFYGGSQTDRD